ncbi:MAG: hypothetical protein ABL967_00430 [Bryobacteraceae bacterium]
MATKKKAAKKHATKARSRKKPIEIMIAKDGSIPETIHLSITKSGGVQWKSEDRKNEFEVYFLCDPFDRFITTNRSTGKTKVFALHKRVAAGDQFNYHVVGPLHPRKGQERVSNLGSILMEA